MPTLPRAQGATASGTSSATPRLVLGMLYENGLGPAQRIGDYQAVAAFASEPLGPNGREVYVFYAIPGDRVLTGGQPAVPLEMP